MIDEDIFRLRHEDIEGLEQEYACPYCGKHQKLMLIYKNDGFCWHCDEDTDGVLNELCSKKAPIKHSENTHE